MADDAANEAVGLAGLDSNVIGSKTKAVCMQI